MSLVAGITTLATLLWFYVAILTVAWVRLVAATHRRDHVGHFIGLMGVFVPGIALTVATVLIGALVGIPQVVLAIALLFPGALAVGLQLEVGRLAGPDPRIDAIRLGAAVVLATLWVALT